ncbi:MAG TPA: hypothetical protein PKI05_08130 [Thermogutta sp.]|nr:hypothetical protein [Thermogutta sp.]
MTQANQRKQKRKKLSKAEELLALLELSDGAAPTKEVAVALYSEDTTDIRQKVRRLARTLRSWGYRVYGFGGIYKLCTQPQELAVVFERNTKLSRGAVLSADDVAEGIRDLGDPEMAASARNNLKTMLMELTEVL